MILVRKADGSEWKIVAFSAVLTFNVRLPYSEDENSSLVHLSVVVRDTLNYGAVFKMTPVTITQDTAAIDNLIETIQASQDALTSNFFVALLSSGCQNIVTQIITTLSQEFNSRYEEILAKVISSK